MNEVSDFRPAKTQRASEVIYDQIKERILSGEFQPGDRLPSERSMMEQFQRSRPTVREALRMLERSGFIRTIPGSTGAIVMAPDIKNVEETLGEALQLGSITIEELAEFRETSENMAVSLAVERADETEIEAMRSFLDEMEANVDDYRTFVIMDSQFHNLIALAAHNRTNAVVNKTLSMLNRSFMLNKMETMTPTARKKMCREVHAMHKAIFIAIRTRDAARARIAMSAHLNAFRSDLK